MSAAGSVHEGPGGGPVVIHNIVSAPPFADSSVAAFRLDGTRRWLAEHIASPTPTPQAAFLAAIGTWLEDEDPDNRLVDVETQLCWMREAGFVDVDCLWKWREMALLHGRLPG